MRAFFTNSVVIQHDNPLGIADPVREVAERLGISTKSIYTWQRLFSRPVKVIQEVDAQADEIRRLKRDLARVTSGRDILKKGLPVDAIGSRPLAGAYFAKESR